MMRKLLATLALASGLQAPALASPPEDPGKSGAVDFCAEVVLPNVPSANLGECVSILLVSTNGYPAHECDAFLEIAPDVFYTVYDSYSDCVRTYS
ncbi:MAG TPA: hypothetical protein VM760_03275 [Sphingomicrobium sp.]|nr:hypothetical protein [Sphingomicrobium sp.]